MVTDSYCLHCSVCGSEYSSKADWNSHLFTDFHQFQARKQCFENWDQNLRQRCLLLFSSFPLGQGTGAAKLVHHLSQRFNFVTDLVFWKERPRLALVQFESRQKAEQVLMAMEIPAQLQLGIRLKLAAELGDLEWKAVLPPVPNSAPIQSTRESNAGTTKEPIDPVESTPPTCSSSKKLKRPAFPSAPPSPPLSSFASSLELQFWTACQSIRITEQTWSTAKDIVHTLTAQFHEKDPTVRLCLFRNCFLQLRNPNSSNSILVYLTNENTLRKKSRVALYGSPLSWIKGCAIQQVFSMPTCSKVFQVLESHPDDTSSGVVSDNEVGWHVIHRPSQLSFRLIASKRFLAEVQMCKMVEYLCTFDPRCYPLLNLVYYWANLNNVTFGRTDLTVKTHRSCPEPITLQWLVIFFLSQKGIIPSPRQVQARPHQVLEEKLTGTDIGFEADVKWAEDWKSDLQHDKLVPSVLTLFKDFLLFYGQRLAKDKWILNTRDGNMVTTNEFLKCSFSRGEEKEWWAGKMSDEELANLKYLQGSEQSAPCLQKNGQAKATECKVNLRHWKLYILHPFVLLWKLSVVEGIGREVERCYPRCWLVGRS